MKRSLSAVFLAGWLLSASVAFAAYSASDFKGASSVYDASGVMVVQYASLSDLDCGLRISADRDRKLIFRFYDLEAMNGRTVEFKADATRTDLEHHIERACSSSSKDYDGVIAQKKGFLSGFKLSYVLHVQSMDSDRFWLTLVQGETKKERARAVRVAVSREEIMRMMDE